MFMSREQNAGQNRNIKIDSKSLKNVEKFKCLGTTLKNQHCLQEEIKNILNPGMPTTIRTSLLPRNIKIKIHRTTILPVALYACEAISQTKGSTQTEGVRE